MTISYDKKVLIKRGNTASVSSYVGPLGELVLDTDTKKVYVQDGATVGGIVVTGSGYGNTEVAAYLQTDSTITSLGSTVTEHEIKIDSIGVEVGAVTAAINSLIVMTAAQAEQLTITNTNIVTANTAMKSYVDSIIVSTDTTYSNVNVAAYLSENPIASSIEVIDQQFVSDGVTSVYTLLSNSTTSSAIVSINGIVQAPILAYSISSSTLTFTEAPAIDDFIDIRIFNIQRPLLNAIDLKTIAASSTSFEDFQARIAAT